MSREYFVYCRECPRHWYTEEQCQGQEVCPKNERHSLGFIFPLPELPGAEGKPLEMLAIQGDLLSSEKWQVCIPQIRPAFFGRSDSVENAVRALIQGYFFASEYNTGSYPVKVSMSWIEPLIAALPDELRSGGGS